MRTEYEKRQQRRGGYDILARIRKWALTPDGAAHYGRLNVSGRASFKRKATTTDSASLHRTTRSISPTLRRFRSGLLSLSDTAVHILRIVFVCTRTEMMTTATTSSTLSPKSGSPGLTVRVGRERSSSIVKVEKVGEESQEEALDQSVYDNVNAEWVNRKGLSHLTQLHTPLPPRTSSVASWAVWRAMEDEVWQAADRAYRAQVHGSFIQFSSSPGRLSSTLYLECGKRLAGHLSTCSISECVCSSTVCIPRSINSRA